MYSIATTWAGMPFAVISRVFSTVHFPLRSCIHDEGATFARVLRRTRRPWLILGGCATTCLVSAGPTLIHLLYESRAVQAGWIIQVLATGVWLLSLEAANSIALLAPGPVQVAGGRQRRQAGGHGAADPARLLRLQAPGRSGRAGRHRASALRGDRDRRPAAQGRFNYRGGSP